MEISIGDYVRTDKGYIFIVDKERKNLQALKFFDVEYGNIVKHSKNIIDLIEKDDYVNGYKVCEINKKRIGFEGCHKSRSYYYFEDNDFQINSIITKEQIQQIEFIVKE